LYDEKAMIEHARSFKRLFVWARFLQLLWVKACPNPTSQALAKRGSEQTAPPAWNAACQGCGITGKKSCLPAMTPA
jgi:hypothetical protein